MKKSNLYQQTIRRFSIYHFLVILFLWLLSSYIFYLRFPNNFLYPNFYAEDGSVFAQNVYNNGLIHSLFTTFDGYYIWGIYLLEGVGFGANSIIHGHSILGVPRLFSITSYLFLGICATLPFILLRRYLNISTLAILWLGLTLVPIPSDDFAIIGTIGNLKYAFAYIAFLLILYRWHLNRTSKKSFLVDIGIVICGYTNGTVYLFLPLLLFCDGITPKQILNKETWKVKNASLVSAAILVIVLSVQIFIIKLRGGIPKLPGYLDEPMRWHSLPEIFFGRTLAYPLLFWNYTHLHLWVVFLCLSIVLGAVILKSRKFYLWAILSACYCALTATGLFLINRTGLSTLFGGFVTSGPDQFFYAANWIVDIGLAILIERFFIELPKKAYFIILGSIFTYLMVTLPQIRSSFDTTTFEQRNVGTIYYTSAIACAAQPLSQNEITVKTYPVPGSFITEDRISVCGTTPKDAKRHSIK